METRLMVLWLMLCVAVVIGHKQTEQAAERDGGTEAEKTRESTAGVSKTDDVSLGEENNEKEDEEIKDLSSEASGVNKETEDEENDVDNSSAVEIEEIGEAGLEIRTRLVVGLENGWARGRVEEEQLLASAHNFNYNIEVNEDSEVPSCDENGDNFLMIFLPRGEGVVQSTAAAVVKRLRDARVNIILPHHHLHALAGWSQPLQRAARHAGVTSLAQLAQELHQNDHLRRQFRAMLDTHSRVFHVLDDVSNMDHEGLHLNVTEGRYELRVKGHTPPIILALPTSSHARALLLALSDYLTGAHHPDHGCVSCITPDNEIHMKMPGLVVVAVGVRGPHPFLNTTLQSLLQHGLHPHHTHFYLYNQVEQYRGEVEAFVQHLREGDSHVTLLEAGEETQDEGAMRNKILQECIRLGCHWFINIDSYAFLNNEIPALLLHLGHPVLAPVLRVQRGIESSFWRDIDGINSSPTYSWDHAALMNNQPSARGYWHASCIRGVYVIHRDILERLNMPYTHAHSVPKTHAHPDTDLAFCSALREAGVPMVATTAVPNIGILTNNTHHQVNTQNLLTLESNPVLWNYIYLTPTWREIITGAFSKVMRDSRKDTGLEEVPTVSQWISQLRLDRLLENLFTEVLKHQQLISFPFSLPDKVIYSLVARFRLGEIAGLPQHHDSSSITFHFYLTPSHHYQGGELEFPMQKCRLKPEVGDVLVFPGRLTHPKILHNVTDGSLHKMIVHIDTEIPNYQGK
ncbi:uncharacterized protein LOC121868820 isoform X2 [Homarus americanus]|uniref:uncharacterized protein LOC121868820 isoform X2 n=1 Tax=Homarus americanus TaxID=6706 RepID=UPI001C456A53|nr:uncharacterized protein LOC121868820 isoform X2 [Homarus americanus]